MAKRELSSTLKNLKFMQRAAAKEETRKEENLSPVGDFASRCAVRKCVVIYESDPQPGAIRGRMSFLSFNPSIDKLSGEASSHSETKSGTPDSTRQSEELSIREDSSSNVGMDKPDWNPSSSNASSNCDLKRKQVEVGSDAGNTIKLRKYDQEKSETNPSSHGRSHKQHRRENNKWKALLPPKYGKKLPN